MLGCPSDAEWEFTFRLARDGYSLAVVMLMCPARQSSSQASDIEIAGDYACVSLGSISGGVVVVSIADISNRGPKTGP